MVAVFIATLPKDSKKEKGASCGVNTLILHAAPSLQYQASTVRKLFFLLFR